MLHHLGTGGIHLREKNKWDKERAGYTEEITLKLIIRLLRIVASASQVMDPKL